MEKIGNQREPWSEADIEIYDRNLNDPEYLEERFKFYISKAKKILESHFGQSDLTIIEQAKLKEITKACIRQKVEETILVLRREMPADKMIDVKNEIVYRWLWELYDIKRSDIPGLRYGNETLDVPEDFREYLRRLRNQSHLV